MQHTTSKANGQTIIKKHKKSKTTDQIKEGAWKLAYADFVTAMMCFFMLMWLFNTTPSQKLKSMATYFKPTIDFFSKQVSSEEGIKESEPGTKDFSQHDESNRSTSNEDMSNIEDRLKSEVANDPYVRDLSSNISTQMSKDGLEITIFDHNAAPMFEKGGSKLTIEAKRLIEVITNSILYVPNRIVIGGYTEKAYDSSITGYSSWDLTAARANSARKVMQIVGMPSERIAKLVAYGDNVPFDENDPYAPSNRRITITLLNKWSNVKYKVPISNSAIALDN
jgi:chemotaxis protein MotB